MDADGRRTMMWGGRGGRLGCVLGLVAAALAGCQSGSTSEQAKATASSGPPGVEVTWVMVDDRIVPPPPPPPPKRQSSPGSNAPPKPPPPDPTMPLDQALTPYLERPVPISPPTRALWSACGFDVYSVPVVDLPALRSVLRLSGAEQRQRVAASGKWSEIVRGPTCRGVQPVQVDAGAFEVTGGVFRLLMRCWPTPGGPEGTTGAIQVEFVPQHYDPTNAQPEPDDPMATPKRWSVTQEGTVFERLFCETSIPAGEALLIVPRDIKPTEDPAPSDRPFGPDVPQATSLARAILTDAIKGGEGKVRLVLVVTATPPRDFTLTGR